MKIRPATIYDLTSIHRIEQNVFEEPWSKDELLGVLLGVNQMSTWVIELEENLIGYLTAREEAGDVHILNFAIDRPWQHRGWGKKFLRSYINALPENLGIHLEVKRSNWPAIQLYLDEGFQQHAEIPHYYSDGEDALVLVKNIS